jgi:hypothetical protein
MSLCKLCGRSAPLVQAHIIPESMYPFESGRRQPLLKVPSNSDAPLGKSRVGEYDPELVCGPCEAKFSPCDDYASRLLRKEPKPEDCVYVDGEWRAYTIETYDYAKLKLFFVSLLWRASESTRTFFENVSVGPQHTAQLSEMIRNKDPGRPDEYSVCIVRFTDNIEAHKSVMTPQKQRYDGVRFCRFYLAGYMCPIKVDQRSAPSHFSSFVLRPSEALRIIVMKFNETHEFKALVSAVRKAGIR